MLAKTMGTRAWGAAFAVFFLYGCSSFHPNETERGIATKPLAYPLEDCSTKHYDQAVVQATAATVKEDVKTAEHLGFDKAWVCKTAPVVLATSSDGRNLSKEQQEELASANKNEEALRKRLEPAFTRDNEGRPTLGIALSGGGTKASAVATGVLAGLSDVAHLDSADYISSVSGGGYATYFYYAQKLLPKLREHDKYAQYRTRRPSTEDLYLDCIFLPAKGDVSPEVYERIEKFGGCPLEKLRPQNEKFDNRYQAFLKCQQDVFKPANCATGRPLFDSGIQHEVFAGTALAIIPAFFATTLWDWGVTLSPAARTYRDGIGIAYGSTISDPKFLKKAEGRWEPNLYPCAPHDDGFVLDCTENDYNPDPTPLQFDELRRGMLMAKQEGKALPFWVVNAAAPRRRNVFGWVVPNKKDVTNSDMFEMTVVSHGSGRYGYVPTSPEIYRMTVLDSVTASAAFMDANNLLLPLPIKGLLGFGMHLGALDWGQDIPNYNTSDSRRRFHRVMPIPFTWLDSLWARTQPEVVNNEQLVDRQRSVFIRLMDGGNAENLGAFSLLKRRTQNIVISDAGQDSYGQFSDICGLARRAANAPDGAIAHYLYIPGLRDLEEHCKHNDEWWHLQNRSYDIHNWPFEHPVLVGCLRSEEQPKDSPNPCSDLKFTGNVKVNKVKNEWHPAMDTRIFIVKPAVNNVAFQAQAPLKPNSNGRLLKQCWIRGEAGAPTMAATTLNCDTAAYMADTWTWYGGDCQKFPQHGTATMTMNSNDRVFAAYRELARQYVSESIVKNLPRQTDDKDFEALFNAVAEQQFRKNFRSQAGSPCEVSVGR